MAKKNFSVDKKLLAKVLMAVGVLAIVGATGWLVYNSMRDGGIEGWAPDERGNLVSAVDDAEAASLEGDSRRAQEIYDQGIANSEDDNETMMLTVMKAYSLYSDEDYEGALSVARDAEDRWKRVDTAILLGDIHATQGSKDDARRHYQLAIERLDPNEYDYESAKKMLQDKINNL
jgi:predicted negative regulator of RcsB-dependent stress response